MSFPKWALAGLVLILAGCEPPQVEPAAGPGSKTVESPARAEPGTLLEQAGKAANAGQLPDAVTLLERAVQAEPKNLDALWMLAQVAQGLASELKRPQNSPLYLESADSLRKLRAVSKKLTEEQAAALPEALYNEACTYAVANQSEKAMNSLVEACDAGFERADLFESDKELDSLRALPKFQDLASKLMKQARAEGQAQADQQLAANKPFAFDFTLPGLDGKPAALADLKGQVTIVDVWATWCGPCRQEIPHFVALYDKYHDKGLAIVGLNYESEEAEDKARAIIAAFVKEHNVPYPCLIGDEKTQKQIPGFQGYPTTLFIDRAGTVRAKMVGFDPGHAFAIEALVTTLLSETDK